MSETQSAPRTKLVPGAVVDGRYVIDRFVGRGGMAEVYAAKDEVIDREVALKILVFPRSDLGAEAIEPLLERFQREATAAARIRHPNVITIHDYGSYEELGEPYLVMDLLEGHDLATELAARGRLAPRRALELMETCLDALSVAHAMGVVHKDIKPENIFLEHPGTERELLKLVDFGVAHVYDDAHGRLTEIGLLYSTPQYFAPEYVNNRVVSPAFDVYQVALTLVELMTGRPVVTAPTPYRCAVIHGIGDLKLPASLLDGPLGPVLCKALALDHEERYPTAGAFVEALRELDYDAVAPPGKKEILVSLRARAGGSDPSLGASPGFEQPVVGDADTLAVEAVGPGGERAAELSRLAAETAAASRATASYAAVGSTWPAADMPMANVEVRGSGPTSEVSVDPVEDTVAAASPTAPVGPTRPLDSDAGAEVAPEGVVDAKVPTRRGGVFVGLVVGVLALLTVAALVVTLVGYGLYRTFGASDEPTPGSHRTVGDEPARRPPAEDDSRSRGESAGAAASGQLNDGHP